MTALTQNTEIVMSDFDPTPSVMPIENWLRMKAEVVKATGQFANTDRSHLRLIEAADALAALTQSRDAVIDVDWLSNIIRSVDGNNSLGAGALAEKIVEALQHAAPSQDKDTTP